MTTNGQVNKETVKRNHWIMGVTSALWAIFLTVPTSNGEIAIVAGKNSKVTAATTEDVRKIFLGKSTVLGNGTIVQALDQQEGSPAWEEFSEQVLGKSPKQLKSYWSIQIFTGKGVPPQSVGGAEEVTAAVSKNPNAIGYMNAADVTDKVKVLLRVK